MNLYKKIMSLLTDVDVSGFKIRVLQKIAYNRLTYDYRPIHDYCWLILNDFSVQFEEGREKFFAFVLNSWNVYEIFLAAVFKRFQSKFQINSYRIDSVATKINWDVKRDRPNIILSQSGEEKFIIEAKYKTKFQNIDRNQINWYLTQGRKKLPYGLLIYPKFDEIQQDQNCEETDPIIAIKYVDLSRTSSEDYLKNFAEELINQYENCIGA